MQGVNVVITRFVEASFPGWVECKLTDAHGRQWSFIEKGPVVTADYLDANDSYPRLGIIACQVVGRRQMADGCEVITVDTEEPWHVEATTGEVRFDVLPEQLIEFELGPGSDAEDS